MKSLSVVMAFIVLVLTFSVAQAGNEALFARVKDASWAVYVRDVGSLAATCSATAFSATETETQLITAGHCFWPLDDKRDFLLTRDHRSFKDARLIAIGFYADGQGNKRGDDWAVVSIQGKYPFIPLGDSKKLQLGENVLMIGVPFGVDFLAVEGIVGSLDVSLSGLDWNHALGLNLFIAGGNSGTGVISVSQQAIIAIIVAGPGNQTSLALATQISLVNIEKGKANLANRR